MKVESLNLNTSRGATTAYVARPQTEADAAVILIQEAACEIAELGAAAPFYGDIPEESVLAKMKVPTLFIAGKRDAWINPEKVNKLKEISAKYNLPVEVISYDADHAFFNDTRPQVYNAEAAADVWGRVLAHFKKHLAE